jgi:hypothetical protein
MLYLEYYKKIREIEERIICDEKNMILKVARLMSGTIKNDGLIHILAADIRISWLKKPSTVRAAWYRPIRF